MLKRVKKKKTAVKRKIKKAQPKKAAKRKTVAKTAVKKKTAKKPAKKKAAAPSDNKRDHWKDFRVLKAKIEKNLKKLKKDFKAEKKPEDLIEDINLLGLLGGECHYMMRMLEKASKKKSPARR